MRVDAYVTVWGAPFVEKFLTYSLASELSPGNIPALARSDVDLVYHIYTDRASEPYFHPGVDELARHAEVRFRFYEDVPYKNTTLFDAMAHSRPESVKHNVQRLTALRFLSEAAEQKSDATLLLDSDFIFSDGSWPYLIDAQRAGAKAVCAMFLRLEQATASPRLKDRIAGGMSGREIVALGLETLHPTPRSMFVDAQPFAPYPSQLNWWVGEGASQRDGFVTHCFFPHPLLTVPSGTARYMSTMDYEYALRAAQNDAEIHLVRDSDDLLVCKMSPASYGSAEIAGDPLSVATMARFAFLNTNLRHRLFMDQPIRFVAGGAEADWQAVETRSKAFIEEVYAGVDAILGMVQTDPRTLVYLKSFLGPIEDFASPQTMSRLKGWM